MKLPLLFLFFVVLGNTGWSQSIMTFERIYVKADTLVQNSVTPVKIKFMNTGNKPLVISGCTPEFATDKCTFDKKAVAAGQTAFLTYIPDASTCGKFSRNIVVTSKDGETVTLHMKGIVNCPPLSEKSEDN